MKNLLIYINPSHDFGEEEKITVKIQIDNSLDLGWKKEDILLVTNFPYEYRGIKALIVGDENYCVSIPATSKINTIVDLFMIQNLIDMFKINTIIDLFDKKIISKPHSEEKGELYWYHDLDVFQNFEFTEQEIESELGKAELGLTDKGRMPRWNSGTLFFRESAVDIFNQIKEIAYKYGVTDEDALMVLYTNNLLWATEPELEETIDERVVPANIPGMEKAGERIKKINITYNLRMVNIDSTYKMGVKPIRAIQFHPFAPAPPGYVNNLDFFMYGKNKINTVLMSERLIKIFHKHGVR